MATKPVDFRKGHDGLAALVKNELHKDPFTGTVLVSRSRKADRLKLIYWDGSGIVMAYKWLEEPLRRSFRNRIVQPMYRVCTKARPEPPLRSS